MQYINYILKPVIEIYALLPDSILFGSLLLYFLTQNYSYAIFAVFILEVTLSHRLISWFVLQTVGIDSGTKMDIQCRAGFKTPQLDISRMFAHEPYPSYSTFTLTSIATYLGLSTNYFSNIYEKMGKEWELHKTLSYIFIGLVMAIFICVRLRACNESINEILFAVVAAIICSIIFFYINHNLFGIEAINFLGVPYLVDKTNSGEPIYVCSR